MFSTRKDLVKEIGRVKGLISSLDAECSAQYREDGEPDPATQLSISESVAYLCELKAELNCCK